MTSRNRRRDDMLVRVRAFCVDRRDIFEGTPLGATMLAALDESVTEVSDGFAMQSSGRGAAREGTTSRRQARAALRRSLESIHRTSRFLELATVGIDDRFPRPRHASDRELVADARAVAQCATPLTDTFVARGLPAGVLLELRAQIQALERAILHQTAGKESNVGAKAAVSAALTSGVTAVEALESIVLNAPLQDPEMLAIWRNARRVGPARLKQAAAVAPAPGPTPATPSSATLGTSARVQGGLSKPIARTARAAVIGRRSIEPVADADSRPEMPASHIQFAAHAQMPRRKRHNPASKRREPAELGRMRFHDAGWDLGRSRRPGRVARRRFWSRIMPVDAVVPFVADSGSDESTERAQFQTGRTGLSRTASASSHRRIAQTCSWRFA